jgi:hypothetical protein
MNVVDFAQCIYKQYDILWFCVLMMPEQQNLRQESKESLNELELYFKQNILQYKSNESKDSTC